MATFEKEVDSEDDSDLESEGGHSEAEEAYSGEDEEEEYSDTNALDSDMDTE